ncbi:THUMP-like domain-containing protein [Parapedobacter sp. DT-150]|uniref:THUMP-like domain-containing protein n=1 Tax=Parapedobacter sp. DT-150 TaxID=3396162 RepID=UPI003F1B106B
MNRHLLTPEVQQYLRAHETMAPADMALAKSPFAAVSSAELAQQLDGRQRCRKKLPLWYDTSGIYYPEKLSLEQTSSQVTAAYKTALLPPHIRVADLTGGFGIDAYFFAQRATSVIHCERNASLSEIARHNASILGADDITFIAADGLEYLKTLADDTMDCIYLDPSRRVDKRKVFRLEDCEPNVVAVQRILLQKAGKVLVKSAPLLDISAALGVLQHVSEVHILSADNEAKELLFLLDRAHAGAPLLTAAALKGGSVQPFSFHAAEEKAAVADFGPPGQYLYEPDAALLKAGAFKLMGQRYGLKKLHPHTHLYTADTVVADFIGKTFQVDHVMPYAEFKKDKSAAQANVSTRNFPLNADTLRKKHRIGEDGSKHLFFCTGINDVLLVIFASKC